MSEPAKLGKKRKRNHYSECEIHRLVLEVKLTATKILKNLDKPSKGLKCVESIKKLANSLEEHLNSLHDISPKESEKTQE